jgi:putative ABC transport system permease protein
MWDSGSSQEAYRQRGSRAPSHMIRAMWRISLQDLIWRRSRLGIAIFGTAVVMAMALLTSGISAAFTAEAQRSVGAVGGSAWLVPKTSPGVFNTPPIANAADADSIATLPGVHAADPVLILSQSLQEPSGRTFVVVFGYREGGLSRLPLQKGRLPSAKDEAVVDEKLGLGIGSRITLGRSVFTIVGVTTGMTIGGGTPDVFAGIADLDAAQFNGQPVANAIVVEGSPAHLPAGYRSMSVTAVVNDSLLPLTDAIAVVTLITYLFWVVAAMIVAAFIFLSTNERRRDFAVMKAIGVGSRSLGGGVILQSTVVALSAAVVSIGLAYALAPIFPIDVAIPPLELVILPIGALAIGLLASLLALRRVLTLDPALAFAGAG